MLAESTSSSVWHELAHRVLQGESITEAEAASILEADDDQLLDILAAAFRVRKQHFGKTVQLYLLMNAKSGLCPEDCSYCSQSKVATSDVPKYNLLNEARLQSRLHWIRNRGDSPGCGVFIR